MGFLKRLVIQPIEVQAQDAWDRGDLAFANRLHFRPLKGDADLAQKIHAVEAIGWKLHSRVLEGEGLERSWHLLFQRP
ncbi:hypothetical protein ACWDHW_08075 [Streptomyces melanosporofaciens]